MRVIPTIAAAALRQDPLDDPVVADHVHHRVAHRDVRAPHVGADVAAGHGRHHQLGDPERQRAHRLGRQHAVPPEPPSAAIASSCPSACSRRAITAAPAAIARTAAPRSPAWRSDSRSAPGRPRHCGRVDVGFDLAFAEDARVDEGAAGAAGLDHSRQRAYSWPLVSSVPTRTTVVMPPRQARAGGP